jgi:hypothetical protein
LSKQESERQYRTSTLFTISEENSQNITSCSTLCGTDIRAWHQEFMESILFTLKKKKRRRWRREIQGAALCDTPVTTIQPYCFTVYLHGK